VVQGDGAGAEEDERKGEGCQGKGEFVSAVAHESVVEVNFGDGDRQINADGEGGYAREQAEQDEDAAEEFCERREIAGPGWEPEAGDELSVVVESAENFVVSVAEHDCAERKAHDEKRERLQAIKVAHGILRRKKDRLQQPGGGGKQQQLT
jgi:hypothetical protein